LDASGVAGVYGRRHPTDPPQPTPEEPQAQEPEEAGK